VTDAFHPRSDFLRVMQERGFVHQCSDLTGLDDKARSGALAGYIGFDCTAPSLHVGNLVSIMMLHWLQETGGKPVALILGNEEKGLDPATLAACDEVVTIPGSGRVQSLNVAAAAAILIYLATRS